MGQTPHYLQDTENPAAIEALLTYLARLLNLTLDMSQFPKAVREFRAECDRAVAKSREAAGQSGLLVDELVVEREEIAFNAGSTMVSIVMRAAGFRAPVRRAALSLRSGAAGRVIQLAFTSSGACARCPSPGASAARAPAPAPCRSARTAPAAGARRRTPA
jgi:hypothetical protein